MERPTLVHSGAPIAGSRSQVTLDEMDRAIPRRPNRSPRPSTFISKLNYVPSKGRINPTSEVPLVSPHKSSTHAPLPLGSTAPAGTSKNTFRFDWYVEISFVFLSLGTFTTAAVLLLVNDGKSLSSWTFYFTINTVISILMTTSRTSMAFAVSQCLSQGKWNWFSRRSDQVLCFHNFEEAARGPMGSASLIASGKWRRWATLGALVTVLAIGFDPFTQALISNVGELDNLPSDSITRGISPTLGFSTSSYFGSSWVPVDQVSFIASPPMPPVAIPPVVYSPDLGVASSFYQGIHDGSTNSSTADAPFTCRAGNCTWPLFASLAVCPKCVNISSSLVKSRGYGTNGSMYHQPYADTLESNYTTWQIPGRVALSNVDGWHWQDQSTATMRAFASANFTSDPSDTTSFRQLDTMVAAFSILQADAQFVNNDTEWQDSTVSATECALYFCINLYNSSVINGTLFENTVASWSLREPDSWVPNMTSISLISSLLPKGNSSDKRLAAVISRQLVSSHPATGTDDAPTSDEMEQALQMIHSATGYSLAYYDNLPRSDLQLNLREEDIKPFGLSFDSPNIFPSYNISQETISSSIEWLSSAAQPSGNTFTRTGTVQTAYPVGSQDSPSILLLGLLQPKNSSVSDTFDHVAKAITTFFRTSSGTDPVSGAEQQWVYHIRVTWAYGALPVLVILGGCVYVASCVWDTYRLGMPAFKSSTLAVLAYALDVESRVQLRQGAMRGDEGLEKAAKSLVVRLKRGEKGHELGGKSV